MGNQYENQEFRNAARAAGVRGKDWAGNSALKDCSTAFHNRFSRGERAGMNYHEMLSWASDWWSQNSFKYTSLY